MSSILFVSSEVFPLIKTGGLADVAGSLPVALQNKSEDIRILMPAYPEVISKIGKHKVIASLTYYNLTVSIIETRLPGSNVKVWLVDCPSVYDRSGGPYADQHGQPWEDNALRFTILCHAAVDIGLNKLALNWQPDIVHCNDWQSGLVPALLSLHNDRPATIFTIHNLAYQGNFSEQTFNDLHLPKELWHMEGLEFYGQFSFIKGGIVYADKINTVSPTYAQEILKPEFGYGLDGLLQSRSQHLYGILNGIDEKHWNPGTDKLITQKYNHRSLNKKVINKISLQEQFSLPVSENTLLVGMIGRMVEQKGLDIILQSLDGLTTRPVQLVILGTGDTHYELRLSEWASRYPRKIKVIIGYNEDLAHKIEAASDLFLMPSTFEPCGLNQMYSLRYGTLPVVTKVGGLADTVVNAEPSNIKNDTANGFVLAHKTADGLLDAIDQALVLYNDSRTWQQLQKNAMRFDSSWQTSAENYIHLYQLAIDQV